MSETKKVHLLVEAEVDVADGFDGKDYNKIAAGALSYALYGSFPVEYENQRFVIHLEDGRVAFKDPRPILSVNEIVEDDGGVYLFS
jgi:hypothetical protein